MAEFAAAAKFVPNSFESVLAVSGNGGFLALAAPHPNTLLLLDAASFEQVGCCCACVCGSRGGGGGVWCVVCGVWCVVCGVKLSVCFLLVCGVYVWCVCVWCFHAAALE